MQTEIIEKMDGAEKLHAMEQLWDALSKKDIEPPSWHQKVLADRMQLYESGEGKYMSLEETRNDLLK